MCKQQWWIHGLACVISGVLGNSAYGADAVETLAASCYACHGPQGNSLGTTAVLAGMPASEIISKLQHFRDGSLPATVMHQHAKGLTETEITTLAEFFAKQPKQTPPSLPRQSFKGAQ